MKELQKSEEELRQTLDATTDGIYKWNFMTNELFFSPRYYTMLGYEPNEFPPSYESWLSLIHPDDLPSALGVAEEYLKTKSDDYENEFRLKTKEGGYRWIRAKSRVVERSQDGDAVLIIGSQEDITERKRAEEGIKKVEEKYRNIFESAVEGIFQTTPDGRYLAVNTAQAHMLGYNSPEELIKTVNDINAQIYVKKESRSHFLRILEKEGFIRGYEIEFFKKDGSIIWVSSNARAVRDENGRTLYYEGFNVDITERKRADETLRESEERYRLLFNGITDAVYVHEVIPEKPGKFIAVNDTACRMLGYTRDEFLQMEVKDIDIPEQSEKIPSIQKKLYGDGHTLFETCHVAKDGRRIPVEINIHLFEVQGKPMVLSVVRDITERKRAKEETSELLLLLESVPNSIVVHDADGNLLYANQRAFDMHGYSRDEFMTTNLHRITVPASEKLIDARIQEIIDRDETSFEVEHLKKNGTILPLWINVKNATWGGKSVFLSVQTDITERKGAEEKIRRNNEFLKNVIESISQPFLVINAADYMIRLANSTALSGDVENALTCYALSHKRDKPCEGTEHVCPLEQVIKTKKPITLEHIHYDKEGNLRNIEVNGYPIFDDQGNIIQMIEYNTDITERKRAEEALLDSRNMLQTVLNSIPSAVFWKDCESIYLGGNRTWLEAAGLKSSEEVKGKSDYDLPWEKKQADSFREDDKKVMESGIPEYGIIEPYLRDNGTRAWAKTNKVPLRDKEGNVTGVMGTYEDITEHKQAEEKIQTLLEEKELLLREVHHRIKNNMGTMMSLLSLQSKTLEDPTAIAALGDAKSRLGSMGVLYDKLYRTENLREMSIKEYLPALVNEIIDVFPNKGAVKIETQIDDFILGVKVLSPLGIIVNELLTNAMKYAFIDKDDGLITVSATIKDHLATLVIEDNGNGIPKSITIETSSGFGLQLVDMLTKQIDGTIRIERGKGTRFVLEFERK